MPRKKAAPPAAWNVLVFLNAKNDLEPFSFLNFEQMAKVGSTDRVNVLVEFGRPQRHYVDLYGAWSKTLRFRVTKARQEYPAQRTLLAIWDHGQGWRRRMALTVRGTATDVRGLARGRERTR